MNDSIKKLISRIEKYKKIENDFPSKIHGAEWIAKPDKNGKSITVYLNMLDDTNLSRKYNSNGQTYLRSDTSWLFEKYNVSIKRLNGGNNGKIISYKLNGFNNNKLKNKPIRDDIRTEIYKKTPKCPHSGLNVDNIDHKNGRDNNKRVLDIHTQTIDDFQGFSHNANAAKRTHCNNCKKSNIRFDAKVLGFPKSYIIGNEYHDGSENGCVGCYWYDPYLFKQVSCGMV